MATTTITVTYPDTLQNQFEIDFGNYYGYSIALGIDKTEFMRRVALRDRLRAMYKAAKEAASAKTADDNVTDTIVANQSLFAVHATAIA